MDLPPWAKIEGVKRLMEETDINKPLIHLTVRGSYTGWVLGHYGRELGYDIKIAYGNSKNYPRESLDKIESYGVELVPLRPNMMKILYNSMKKMGMRYSRHFRLFTFRVLITHIYLFHIFT